MDITVSLFLHRHFGIGIIFSVFPLSLFLELAILTEYFTIAVLFSICPHSDIFFAGSINKSSLSLFFVILRGDNDSLLKWPFRQKVTFILIDQSLSESKENVYDAFRPDPNSSSFRQPVTEMNVASGLPVFCPLGKLMSTDHEYIKDNNMFIKIVVDIKDLESNEMK